MRSLGQPTAFNIEDMSVLSSTRYDVDAALVICALNRFTCTPASFKNCLHHLEMVSVDTSPRGFRKIMSNAVHPGNRTFQI